MTRYSVAEAKNNLPKLLDLALKGEEVVITRRGEPIARIAPEKRRSSAVDIDWILRHRVVPETDADLDSAALVRQMRDEGY